jgi:hypothetical protein
MRVGLALLAMAFLLVAGPARAASIAIAGFSYVDSSGEQRDQSAEHAARMVAFLNTLRDDLAAEGQTALLLDCAPACKPPATALDDLEARARAAGATLLIVGGIHKVSTLIQDGLVQVVDIARNRIVVQRDISFRGDTDDAWRHAASFIASSVRVGLAGG